MLYKSEGNQVFIGKQFVSLFRDEAESQYVAAVLNQELGKYEQIVKNHNDELATKDAVIEAQSERIAELERVLKQVDSICADGGNMRVLKIEALIMTLQLEESEADNG